MVFLAPCYFRTVHISFMRDKLLLRSFESNGVEFHLVESSSIFSHDRIQLEHYITFVFAFFSRLSNLCIPELTASIHIITY